MNWLRARKYFLILIIFILISILLAVFYTKKSVKEQDDKSLLTGRWSKYVSQESKETMNHNLLEFVNFFEKNEKGDYFIIVRSIDLARKEQQGYLKGLIQKFDDKNHLIEIGTVFSEGKYIFINNWDFEIKQFVIQYQLQKNGASHHLILYLWDQKTQQGKKLGDFIKDKS